MKRKFPLFLLILGIIFILRPQQVKAQEVGAGTMDISGPCDLKTYLASLYDVEELQSLAKEFLFSTKSPPPSNEQKELFLKRSLVLLSPSERQVFLALFKKEMLPQPVS